MYISVISIDVGKLGERESLDRIFFDRKDDFSLYSS
jgi:hypothetical protein